MLSQEPTLGRFCVLLLISLFITTPLTAQEDCTNGLDDDGDGLVDLNDLRDCSCSIPSRTISLLPNPSLEEFSAGQEGCTSRQPGGLPDNTNQANCLVGWQRASLGTTDSWNAFTLPGAAPSFPAELPQPLPSGTGVAGFWVGIGDVSGVQFRNDNGRAAAHYREYLAACLTDGQSLEQGLDYRLKFSLGFMSPQQLRLGYSSRMVNLASPDSIELSVYGVRECGQLNFGGFYDCPELAGAEGYELIANVRVSGEPGSWTTAAVDFVSPGDYAGFAIGGSCTEDIGRPDGAPYRNYYFIDELILNRREIFEQPVAGPVAVSGQTICAEEIVLTGQPTGGVTYQWYHDGVAIAGATEHQLVLTPSPDMDGGYQLRKVTPAGCAVTEAVVIQRPVLYDQFPDSVALCHSRAEVTLYPSQLAGATYTWSDGSTEPTFTVAEPGHYSVTVSTACLQRVEEFVAVRTTSFPYTFRLTPEKPCTGDTVELVLETDWYVPLIVYLLPNGQSYYNNGRQPIQLVAGEVASVQTFTVGPCGILFDRVSIPALPPFTAEARITDLNCHGPQGLIDLTVANGAGTRYRWTGPDNQSLAGTDQLAISTTGDYTLELSGSDRCTTSFTYTVGNNREFSLTVDAADVICGEDATALAVPSGGTPPYRVDWFKAPDDPPILANRTDATGLDRGTFIAAVTDSAGCRTERVFTVKGPDPLRMSTVSGFTECHSDTAGTITVRPTGGTRPYHYMLSDKAKQVSPTFTGLSHGDHQLVVTDSLGCSTPSETVAVRLPTPFTVDAGDDLTIYPGESAELTLTVAGIAPESGDAYWALDTTVGYDMQAYGLSLTRSPRQTIRYYATFVGPDGCQRRDSVTVAVDHTPRIYAPTAFSPNGDGTNDRFTLYSNPLVTDILHLDIYDRWGGHVWSRPSVGAASWNGLSNGQPLSTGLYLYRAELQLLDGTTSVVDGSVILLR